MNDNAKVAYRRLADLELDMVCVEMGLETHAAGVSWPIRQEPVIIIKTGAVSIDYRPNHSDLTPLIRALRGLRRATRLTGGGAPFQTGRPQMTKDEITERAAKIVSENLGVDLEKVTHDAKFIDDLGADSLDFVELTMSFEEEFDIEIPDDAAENLQTFGQAVNWIAEKLSVSA